MSNAEITRGFTEQVLRSIESEENEPTRPRRPVLVTLSVRLPLHLKAQLRRAARKKGIEQTQLIRHSLIPMLEVLLTEEKTQARLDLSAG